MTPISLTDPGVQGTKKSTLGSLSGCHPSSLDSRENLPVSVPHTDFTLSNNELVSFGSLHSGRLQE